MRLATASRGECERARMAAAKDRSGGLEADLSRLSCLTREHEDLGRIARQSAAARLEWKAAYPRPAPRQAVLL
jgi:hypothetical protein